MGETILEEQKPPSRSGFLDHGPQSEAIDPNKGYCLGGSAEVLTAGEVATSVASTAEEERVGVKRKSYVKRLLQPPRTDHPAAQQKTPFNLNRYILLVIYFVYVLLTGGVHYGWRSISAMLGMSGAYAFLCEPDGNGGYIKETPPDSLFYCDQQDVAVENLFSIALACQFAMAAVAGIMMDTVGHKLVAMLGQFLSMCCWILLSYCGPNFVGYVPAFMLLGMGSDTGFMPTLVICNLFPVSSSWCLTFLGAAVSASFAVPLVLEKIWVGNPSLSFQQVCWSYTGICNGACFLVALFLIPWKGFKGIDTYDTSAVAVASTTETFIPSEQGKTVDENGLDFDNVPRQRKSSVLDNNKGSRKASIASQADFIDIKLEVSNVASASPKNSIHSRRSSYYAYEGSQLSNKGQDSKTKDVETKPSTGRFRKPPFLPQLLSYYYMFIVVYFCAAGLAFTYYTMVARRLLGPSAEEFLKIMMPVSCVACVILGKVIDVFGIMNVILGVNGCGVLMYLTAIVGSLDVVVLSYISVVFHIFYASVFTSQLYCYVERTFSSSHFGKLIGLGELLGGGLSMISILFYKVTVEDLSGNTLPLSVTFLCMLLLIYPMIIYTTTKLRKNPAPFENLESQAAFNYCGGGCFSKSDAKDRVVGSSSSFVPLA